MNLGVAISLIAAICLGSPAMASSHSEEQMVKDRGARDRSSGGSGNNGGERREGGSSGATTRSDGESRSSGGELRAAERPAVAEQRPDSDHLRHAVPTSSERYGPAAVAQSRPTVVNVYRAPYYRPRYYAPAYYHNWARSYYRWSPIGYAPWPLIYGSIGFSNFGFYTAFGTTLPGRRMLPWME